MSQKQTHLHHQQQQRVAKESAAYRKYRVQLEMDGGKEVLTEGMTEVTTEGRMD